MLKAFLNDMFQRVVTFDKINQRKNLLSQVQHIGIARKSRVLDFGCGTALFARTFIRLGAEYVGYDIDKDIVKYAAKLYPAATFTADINMMKNLGKYDLIIANCCFHHMDNATVQTELKRIKICLKPGGTLLILDIFKEDLPQGSLRRLFLLLERGVYLRKDGDYHKMVSSEFMVVEKEIMPLTLFPWKCFVNPIASNILMYQCIINDSD